MPEIKKNKIKKRVKETFSQTQYLSWFECMLLMRRFEEKAAQLYGQQKIRGFCHLYTGQEACAAGTVSALQDTDKYITAYRDHALPLALGSDARGVMAELYGKSTGLSKGKGGSMHIFDLAHNFYGGHGIVGGQIPLGVGLAFAEKYKGTKNLCITFMGDGAVRQGAFHESLNLAMHYKLPIIFAIENNGYAMGTSVERTSNVEALYTLGASYDMLSKPVDAMSVQNVHLAVKEASQYIRAQKGPVLLELRTYRYRGHSMSDPAQYRTKEELKSYQAKDPIHTLEKLLLRENIATKATLEDIEVRIDKKIKEAVQFSEDSPFPTTDEVFTDVYYESDYPFNPQ